MPAIWLLATIFTLIMAPFIALQAYILVWILGPAIRRAGRRWEEGRYDVHHARREELQLEYQCGVEDAWAGRVIKAPTLPGPAADRTPTDPDIGAQYTITGKLIR